MLSHGYRPRPNHQLVCLVLAHTTPTMSSLYCCFYRVAVKTTGMYVLVWLEAERVRQSVLSRKRAYRCSRKSVSIDSQLRAWGLLFHPCCANFVQFFFFFQRARQREPDIHFRQCFRTALSSASNSAHARTHYGRIYVHYKSCLASLLCLTKGRSCSYRIRNSLVSCVKLT